MFDKLSDKVNKTDINRFVSKAKYDKDKSELEKKIPDTRGIVKKLCYNAQITEIETKILSISSLATKSALIVIKNKIPDVSTLVKKTDYDTKTSKIENIMIMVNISYIINIL